MLNKRVIRIKLMSIKSLS